MPTLTPYLPHSAIIPTEQRDKINRGILNLIRGGKSPDKAKVFAGYTGKGGLHGLVYANFSSRFAYSEAKRAIEQGQFFTPDSIVRTIAEFLAVPAGETVSDLTCGAGAFANQFRDQSFFGLEIDADAVTVAKYLFPEAAIVEQDLRAWIPADKSRFVVGNPPFALRWMVPQCPMANAAGEAASEDVFVWKAAEALAAGGTACLVAPAAWLSDDLISAKALDFIHSKFERVSELLLPSSAFAAVGVDNFATKIVLLRGWLPSETPKATAPVVVDGRALSGQALLAAWQKATPAYAAFRASLGSQRAALSIADQRSARSSRNGETSLYYRFLRYLSELARQSPSSAPEFQAKWAAANAPATYDKMGNRLSQITPEIVIRQVRAALREIDVQPRALVRIVRTKRGYAVKTYSRAAALAVSGARFEVSNLDVASGKLTADRLKAAITAVEQAVQDRNSRIADNNADAEMVEFVGLNVGRTARRQKAKFDLWSRPLADDFTGFAETCDVLRNYYLGFASHGVDVREAQIDPLARATAKPGSFIAWEMGCGKSLASLAWDAAKRGEDATKGRKSGWTLLVSSALAIELHWRGQLAEYGLLAWQPDSRSAWSALASASADGQRFILATHYQIAQQPKLVRGLVRQGIITGLIVDESDEFKNRGSQRTQALQVAGREIRHKALLTGTPVRNNAAELYPQLALLLHGEPFFRCVAPTQIEFNSRINDFVTKENPDFLASYHGRGGLALFKRCHAPARPTVMGAERALPQLPSRKELETFLACFRSRVRLSSLLDHVPFVRQTMPVTLGTAERRLYDKTAEQAIEIARAHLSADRSERRATMLSLAHAIRLLQQVASMPNRFGLEGQGAKEAALIDGIRDSEASHVAVGVIWRESVVRLLPVLEREFPDRVIVAFDGEDSFAQRRKKLKMLEAAPRGLLLCTQQSVRSSLNLPIVGEVFAESFPWNFTSLNQFVMRFCRLTSRKTVKVNLLVATDTIEERILGLLVTKEQVAAPVAGDDTDESDLIAEYGIPAGDLDELARYLSERDPSLRESREKAA